MKTASVASPFFLISLLACLPALGSGFPEKPRQCVDVTMPETAVTRTVCRSGCDYRNHQLQRALDEAKPGTTLVLEAGATYTGRFLMRKKAGRGWIVVTSSALRALPGEGKRVSPADAVHMPKLVSPGSAPAVDFEPGAHHYRFSGIEITGKLETTSGVVYDLVRMGTDPSTGKEAQSPAELPNSIVFDRCFVHGTPGGNYKRGIALNTGAAAVVGSYISDIHVVGQETQAIAGWNATGPWLIENNHLEAAGINLLAGGAPASTEEMVVSDVTIRRNHFYKPLSWKTNDPSFAGTHWTVKNLLEIKHGRRFLIDANLFEHCWSDAQEGWAIRIVLSDKIHDVIGDIAFTNNIVRHAAYGIDVCGSHSGKRAPASRILIRNNVLSDIKAVPWSTYPDAGWALMIRNGARELTVDRNTLLQSHLFLVLTGAPGSGLTFTNNITSCNGRQGMHGDGKGVGLPALEHYYPGCKFERNVIAALPPGVPPSAFPRGNFFPASLEQVQFTDTRRGNYRLSAHSPYRTAATDGKHVGADIDAILEAMTRGASETALCR